MMIPTLGNGYLYAKRFDEKWTPEPNSDCWIWTGAVGENGYGRFRMSGKALIASRASWILFKGAIPDGLFVLHHCDTPLCVNPDHLFLGTSFDNNHDCIEKGRDNPRGGVWPNGENHPMVKLKSDQVIAIRNDARKYRLIANDYGVSISAIKAIKNKRIWRHL